SDTTYIQNQRYVFSGTIDTFPKLVSIGFPYPSQKRARIILEPGEIRVDYSEETGFRIGGTENNVTLQKMVDEMKPFDELVSKTWRNWSQIYRDEYSNIRKRENSWDVMEYAKEIQREKLLLLIRKNPNYAGFVMSLGILRYESLDNLKTFIEEFEQFHNDRRFESLKEQYEAAYYTSGHPVPEFTFPDPEGKMVSLSSFKGKWVLLDFWYDGCGWCKRLSPILKNIYYDWKDKKDFEIISISVDKEYERWIKGMKEENQPWIQVRDSTKTYPLKYAISGYPTLILIDKEGNGVEKIIGFHEEGSLRRILEKHIDK
ncbi:MAG TPA: AhpC/TSA family protein, partial [Bacteroidetes bacterium]|nr:AhpC/TSA family protein [Bacteroidota bacterium]